MSDYISRQKLLDYVPQIGGSPLSEWETAGVILAVEKQPAADVAPSAHGRWAEISEQIRPGNGERRKRIKFWCSSCYTPSSAPYNFCPHCWAKMDGGNDDEAY